MLLGCGNVKRVVSLTILIIIVVLGLQFLVTKFTKNYTNKYDIYVDDNKFSIVETYLKDNDDSYDIEISDGTNTFYYVIANSFNKQKKIITNIEYFKNGEDICIYPVLKDNTSSYIECISNGSLYSGYTYSNQDFIQNIINSLKEKGYTFDEASDSTTKQYGSISLYTNNLKETDKIVMWQYKGIYVLDNDSESSVMNLSFDKYENKLGTLVDKYYIMPDYTNSSVLEFSSITVVDLSNMKQFKIYLDYTLSSNTYVNGVIDNKLYYTDPSNLLQVEVNPKNKNSRLIGSNDIGGQNYINGNWENANIYDFTTNEIKFTNIPDFSYSYREIVDGKSSYYYYTSDGDIYQLIKGHLDNPILIYKASNLNNFRAVGSDIYYVVDNTLYYFNIVNGSVPILISNDLIYNTANRISVYRNK